ncbi:MAG: molybdopterin-dependent oxidoreductase, partial [Rhodobacteraceae bacterium]|nr:molybdopterin-dependent oxidoreductase [Paracoccaceae bacterium]
MAKRWTSDLTQKDVTPESLFLNRRQIMAGLAGVGLAGLTAPAARAETLEPTSLKAITTYNNFYEFGTGKEDPVKYGDRLTTDPWTIEIDGMVDRPGAYALGDILSKMTIEERIYRFRCVEAWSMVVPWNGFELADLLDMAGVQSGA